MKCKRSVSELETERRELLELDADRRTQDEASLSCL